MKKAVMTVLLGLVVAGGAPVPAGAGECRRVVYGLVDLSGSYRGQRDAALEELKRWIAASQGGDCLFVRSVGAESWNDPNSLLSLRLPPSARPIDPVHQRRLARMKVQAITRLEALKAVAPEPYTDLWCGVYAASQVLQGWSDAERQLLIFSDFQDNRRRRECQQVRLQGVEVTARLVPRGRDPAAFERRLRFWAKVFTEAGAVRVRFFDRDGNLIWEGGR
jgi:hypothetical protein